LAALAEHGEMPPIAYVIPIAGRAPRSDVLRPYFERPLVTPSLHVWGENDTLAGDTPRALVERFASPQVLTWPGGHTLPTTREGIDALVRFIRSRHAA
jgi:hypothetical protein